MNSITLEQAHKTLKKEYDRLNRERMVRDKVCNVMSDFDNTRLTRRIVATLEAALEGYSVTYYPEKGYERLKIRDNQDFYEFVLNSGNEPFNYDKFETRENSNEFLYQMMSIKPFIDDEGKLGHYLVMIEEFSKALDRFHEFIHKEGTVWFIIGKYFQDMKRSAHRV